MRVRGRARVTVTVTVTVTVRVTLPRLSAEFQWFVIVLSVR